MHFDILPKRETKLRVNSERSQKNKNRFAWFRVVQGLTIRINVQPPAASELKRYVWNYENSAYQKNRRCFIIVEIEIIPQNYPCRGHNKRFCDLCDLV